MTIDEIKQFQAGNGIAIEVADSMGLLIIAGQLRKAMDMSVDYERLCRKVREFSNTDEVKSASSPGTW